jgi:hypothetical protein
MQLLAQSGIDIDNGIKDDILRVMAVGIDAAVLNGAGPLPTSQLQY